MLLHKIQPSVLYFIASAFIETRWVVVFITSEVSILHTHLKHGKKTHFLKANFTILISKEAQKARVNCNKHILCHRREEFSFLPHSSWSWAHPNETWKIASFVLTVSWNSSFAFHISSPSAWIQLLVFIFYHLVWTLCISLDDDDDDDEDEDTQHKQRSRRLWIN